MTFFVEESISKEFVASVELSKLEIQKRPSISFGELGGDVLDYFTVGGGMIAIAKCLIEYLKLKKQTIRIVVKTKEGSMVEVEAPSEKEVLELFRNVEHILIEKTEENSNED